VISALERNNFLTSCWRTGRWGDGIAMLLLPVRLPLYRFRKRALRRSAPAARVPPEAAAASSNEFNSQVHAPFAEAAQQCAVDGLVALFAEAKAQMQGEYRLAGGRVVRVNTEALGSLGDGEDHHAYHRLHWAVRYSQAAAFGCPDAQEALLRELSGWLARNWDDDPVFRWPYTLAERIASLAECLVWSPFLPITAVKQQIWRDACQLAASIEYSLGVHNHLLNDARGLYIASASVPECGEAEQWREKAFEIWEEYFPKLVLEDGTFAEQSSHYHLLLCRTGLEYWLAARSWNRGLPAGFEGPLRRMFTLANDLLRPDGTLPRFGDNSPDHTVRDLWGLMAAAHHHGLLEDAPCHPAVTPLTYYYCGAHTPACSKLAEPAPVRIYPDGGFAILRSGDCELIAHGDPRPQVAPHGDAGRGSFELWRKNEVLIREPGSFWSLDPAERYYRTGRAQNVTCLNGVAPGITAEDRGYLPAWYSTQQGCWEAAPSGAVRFRWNGFERVRPGIGCTRTWQFEQAGTLLFEEKIDGSATLGFESRVCLGDSAWRSLQWDAPSGRGTLAHAQGVMTIEAAPDTQATIEDCKFLEEYGVDRAGKVLNLAGRARLPLTWRLRFAFEGN
jgi:hypothetical protein